MNLKFLIPAAIGFAACTVNAQSVSNGSFETPGPGFVLFEDWQNFGNVFAADAGELVAQDGAISAKMFGAGSGFQSDQVMLQTVDGIQEGQLYTLSAFAQNRSSDALGEENVILIQMSFQDANGTNIEVIETTAIDPVMSPTDTWIESELTGVAPVGTTQILVALLHIQLGSDQGFPTQGGGASFWDNIQLEGGEPPCTNPADLNGDGILNFFDVSLFLEAFSQGCP